MSETKIDTISTETHQALLEKALKDSTSGLEADLQRTKQELAAAREELTAKTQELATALEDNQRVNGELDAAQVQLKAVTEEVASLKSDIAAREAAAKKAEVAAARAAQVENLGLFAKDYVADKAARWAEMPDADWAERLEEWRQLKPVAGAESTKSDSASAMTGTSGGLTTVPAGESTKPTARRAALGLS